MHDTYNNDDYHTIIQCRFDIHAGAMQEQGIEHRQRTLRLIQFSVAACTSETPPSTPRLTLRRVKTAEFRAVGWGGRAGLTAPESASWLRMLGGEGGQRG